MPSHNGGFYEKFRQTPPSPEGQCGWYLLWSDVEAYRCHESHERTHPMYTDDHKDTGRDLVDALQEGSLD